MIPNVDPRQLKRMMDNLGMKNTEVPASRVVIESDGKDIVIENPNVMLIEMQGTKTFQITGTIEEKEKMVAEISEDDIKTVGEQTGIKDNDVIRKALEDTKGDIAEAILKLKGTTRS